MLWGLANPDASLACAENSRIEGDVMHSDKYSSLASLPHSCAEAADLLLRERRRFEELGVFSPGLIDHFIDRLQQENDRGLSRQLAELPPADAEALSLEVMHRSLHRH